MPAQKISVNSLIGLKVRTILKDFKDDEPSHNEEEQILCGCAISSYA